MQGRRADDDQLPAENQQQMVVTWLGQGGFLVSVGGMTVAVDPYLSDYFGTRGGPTRLAPPPFTPDALRPDLVVCSHSHEDHLDPDTIVPLAAASPATHFAGPKSSLAVFAALGIEAGRLLELRRGTEVRLGGIRVTALPAYHTCDSIGVRFEAGGKRFAITGDTAFDERLVAALGSGLDLLAVCINGRGGNMGAREAATLASLSAPAAVVPVHYGLFAHHSPTAEAFVAALAEIGAGCKPLILALGESHTLGTTA